MMKRMEALFRRAPVFYTEKTGSTNDDMKRLSAKGADYGTVLIAGTQKSGRGRMGRMFSSPSGGLYMSELLIFAQSDERLLSITAITAVAVARVLERDCEIQAKIKWPNDILLNGKKLCGILTESVSRGNEISIVVGIGINVNTETFPEELSEIAGSVYTETGKKTDIKLFAAHLIEELDNCFCLLPQKDEKLVDEYRHRCETLGKVVDGGTAVRIDDDFALILQMPDGKEHKKFFGEISC